MTTAGSAPTLKLCLYCGLSRIFRRPCWPRAGKSQVLPQVPASREPPAGTARPRRTADHWPPTGRRGLGERLCRGCRTSRVPSQQVTGDLQHTHGTVPCLSGRAGEGDCPVPAPRELCESLEEGVHSGVSRGDSGRSGQHPLRAYRGCRCSDWEACTLCWGDGLPEWDLGQDDPSSGRGQGRETQTQHGWVGVAGGQVLGAPGRVGQAGAGSGLGGKAGLVLPP